MGKFPIAALFAASALIALPAAAAEAAHSATVHIAVANKPAAQVLREIDLAAAKVCAEAGADDACYSETRFAAERQFERLSRKAVERSDAGLVRISLKGKSRAQIFQEIDTAAATVCKDVSFTERRECVAEAAGLAKQRVAAGARFDDLALN